MLPACHEKVLKIKANGIYSHAQTNLSERGQDYMVYTHGRRQVVFFSLGVLTFTTHHKAVVVHCVRYPSHRNAKNASAPTSTQLSMAL